MIIRWHSTPFIGGGQTPSRLRFWLGGSREASKPRRFQRQRTNPLLGCHPLLTLGFCILRIPNIFSACGVWFTFVYRTQEHRAVGSSGNGLTYSRGNPPSSRLPYPRLLYLYYSTLLAICQVLFLFFFSNGWT